MQERMDFENFRDSLGLWSEVLRPWVESKDCYDLYQKLKKDGERERIVPNFEDTFRAFRCSSPEKVKVVMYLMDPYPRLYKGTDIPQATGIAMDCSNSPDGKLQPSLEKFYTGMEQDLGKKVMWSRDLSYLHEQGVMLLNTELTVKLNKTNSHKGYWTGFHKFFLETVMAQKQGIVYVLSGDESKRMERFIFPMGNIILKVEHPAAAAHGQRDWEHKNIFSKINKLITPNEILWDKKLWDVEPPF